MGRTPTLGPKPRASFRAFPSDAANHPGPDVDPGITQAFGLLSDDPEALPAPGANEPFTPRFK